jgi:hypothetical protein
MLHHIKCWPLVGVESLNTNEGARHGQRFRSEPLPSPVIGKFGRLSLRF